MFETVVATDRWDGKATLLWALSVDSISNMKKFENSRRHLESHGISKDGLCIDIVILAKDLEQMIFMFLNIRTNQG